MLDRTEASEYDRLGRMMRDDSALACVVLETATAPGYGDGRGGKVGRCFDSSQWDCTVFVSRLPAEQIM